MLGSSAVGELQDTELMGMSNRLQTLVLSSLSALLGDALWTGRGVGLQSWVVSFWLLYSLSDPELFLDCGMVRLGV